MAKKFTKKAERYIRLLEEYGDAKTKKAIWGMVPVNEWSIKRWRKDMPGFRQAEAQVWERCQQRKELSTEVAGKLEDPLEEQAKLDPILAKWLTAFRASDDRIEACEEVGLRWNAIQKRLASDREFSRLYNEVVAERNAKAEDILYGQVKKGSISASKAWLQAHDPRYSGKVQVSHEVSGTVRVEAEQVAARKRDWLQQFGGQLSAPEMIEGEVVESEEEAA